MQLLKEVPGRVNFFLAKRDMRPPPIYLLNVLIYDFILHNLNLCFCITGTHTGPRINYFPIFFQG